ncbi:MAG: bifunctional folylpolyglutamate synthase/dihydrofolate synthase [Cyanobacteriota bacterium]
MDSFADLIAPFSRRGVDLGLDRLRRALAELGHPERHFQAVQVAGTNGKGSICSFVESGLRAAGIRCGLYSSPHLVSWTERIRLDASPMAAPELRRILERLQPLGLQVDLTPFELITAAAFVAFAEAGVELAVLEVGLGGRLDATTCHPRRSLIGFGSIGLDHTEVLGATAAAIAAEKAGVLEPGCRAFSAPQSPEVAAVLEAEAARRGAALRWVEPLAPDGWSLGLAGAVQRGNGAVALALLQALAAQGWPISNSAMREGLAAARWPGRLQPWQWQGRPLLLDGAHNLPAAQRLRAELDATPERHGLRPGPRHWVIGLLASKQGPEMLTTLLAPGDRAWLVPVPGHASWSRAALIRAQPALATQLQEAADLNGALQAATAACSGTVVVAGSLYLLGALLAG